MGLKETLLALIKKIRCKCRCLGSIEVTIQGIDDEPLATQAQAHTQTQTQNLEINL